MCDQICQRLCGRMDVLWSDETSHQMFIFAKSVDSTFIACSFHCIHFNITKTYLYNFDPLKPHFYIVKLGFTGYTLFFSYFCSKTQVVGTRKNRFVEAVLTGTHNLCFEQKYEKYQNFLCEIFHFLVVKFSIYLNRHVFVMKHLSNMIFSLTPKSSFESQRKPSLLRIAFDIKMLCIATARKCFCKKG